MKNFIAINGSPRRNGNTAELLKHAVKGAQDAGASAETINLYALNFKGCTSCFAFKLKNRPHGSCAMRDDLTPILERVRNADAIIFGSPIYFMNLSSGMLAFIERFFFSNTIYSVEIPTVFPKKIPSAYFLTMNMNAEQFHYYKMDERLASYATFTDSRYESSIFDVDKKFAYREKNFSDDCAAAYEIGRDLILR